MKSKGVNLRSLAVVALVAALVVSAVINYSQTNQRDRMIEQLTRLDTENEQLRSQVSQRDARIDEGLRYAGVIEDSLREVKRELAVLQGQYRQLEGDYNDLQTKADIPPDDSYAFLREVAYPYPGELKYPFNEPQLQGIHLTYLQKIHQGRMIDNLKEQVDVCLREVDLHEVRSLELKKIISGMQENRADLERIISNKDKEIGIYTREVRRQKTRKVLWQATTVIATAAAIIF